ncbi:MAG: hypothetical protein KAS32_30675 [Candidatus Peribacteraceae bacterium]|nr:hypothetical protein [Candidatus Peribacteraceae bacterium]
MVKAKAKAKAKVKAKTKTKTKIEAGAETEVKDKKESSSLDIALNSVNKKHGSVLRWLSEVPNDQIEYISTGSISLDYALGGGLPRGRIVEIFGWESSGKSTLAMAVAAEANKRGLKCLYIDAERALDPRLPVSYGVDPTMFMLEDAPLTAENHFEIIHDVVGSGDIAMVVVDSVSSLVPKAVMEGKVGQSHVGQLARFLSQECTSLIHLIGNTNCLFIFINQYREKIMRIPGDPRTTSGGNAIKFYSTHRIEVAGSGKTKTGALFNVNGDVIGHKMKFKILKNKVNIPYRSGEIDLIYGQGYDTTAELVDIASDLGIISVRGSWFFYGEDIRVQGRQAFKDLLLEKNKLRKAIRKDVLGILKIGS